MGAHRHQRDAQAPLGFSAKRELLGHRAMTVNEQYGKYTCVFAFLQRVALSISLLYVKICLPAPLNLINWGVKTTIGHFMAENSNFLEAWQLLPAKKASFLLFPVFSVQTWAWHQSSQRTLCKKARKQTIWITDNSIQFLSQVSPLLACTQAIISTSSSWLQDHSTI